MTQDETHHYRYVLREDDLGRFLTCNESQNIAVRIKRGMAVGAGEARHYAEGTIFLDGAARGEPFVDNKRGIYNLDHHEGCVRAFTLATCEQAQVMILKGFDLSGGEWSVFANEPDLDTVLAIWLLINHAAFTGDAAIRGRITPLLRVEGAIDAHGLDGAEFCGLPSDLLAEQKAHIDRLRTGETVLKQQGAWEKVDLLEYTLHILRAVDEIVFPAGYTAGVPEIEELIHVPISKNRMAVVCHSDLGIYEVQHALKRLHGDRVGLIALKRGDSAYTLRLVDSFMPLSLEVLYERLNQADPAVRKDNLWGGADDIGGSPRLSGTKLDRKQIVNIIKKVSQPVPIIASVKAVGIATGLVVACLLVAIVGAWATTQFEDWERGLAALNGSPFVTLLLISVVMTYFMLAARRPFDFGLALPRSQFWVWLIPAALLISYPSVYLVDSDLEVPLGVVPLALALEILFYGVVHGVLSGPFRTQHVGGRWFISVPNATAGLGVSLFFLISVWFGHNNPGDSQSIRFVLVGFTCIFLLGLISGIARERTGSMLPPVLVGISGALTMALY